MKEVMGFIADHPTPKIAVDDGIAYTLNSRDYKGVMIVVLRNGNNDTEQLGYTKQTHTHN